MTTNSHAMRDREYTLEKPAGTYRIAITGASHTMGTGVGDLESFENLVEDRLNAPDGRRYELLNFAVGGYGPLSRLHDLEHRALQFEPDAFMLVGINDIHWAAKELVFMVIEGHEVPWPGAAAIAREAGLQPGLDELTATSRMRPYREELLRWIYRETVSRCRAEGILPIALFIPQPREEAEETLELVARQVELAREEGFEVIDITDAFAGFDDYSPLRLAPWDGHPNREGHRILAGRFHTGLVAVLESPGD
jgi:lysophospholipase L1-like esterase